MQLDIRSQDITITDALRVYLTRRLRFALGRFAGRVTRVSARIADVNGPRGGIDKRCHLLVTLRSGDRVRIEEADADLYFAIDRAAERARRALQRQLERRREMNTDRIVEWSA